MTPKECKSYYYDRFPSHFHDWLAKTNAHEHPGEGTYIPIQDLNETSLQHIPREEQDLFRCALACTILCDQVMYTYFKEDYPAFQATTQYPKMECGITNHNVRPWDIIHNVPAAVFQPFAEFFIEDMREHFENTKYRAATWEAVRDAMLGDKDARNGTHGHTASSLLVLQMQEDFMHREVSVASYMAAFGMAIKHPFYANHIDTPALRAPIQEDIRLELRKLLHRFKSAPWTNDESHISELRAFLQHINESHGQSLANGGTTFGRTQKLVNLYLKYMWSAGYIPRPPHCPVDGVVLEVLRKASRKGGASCTFTAQDIPTSFTNLDEETYHRIMGFIREVAGEHGTPAEWELRIFNARN